MPFQIVRNDITRMKVDAIVNTASPEPGFGRGTDSAVYEKAGEGNLLARRRKIGRIKTGEAAITSAFLLDAKYIIHTVGPRWQGGQQGEEKLLRRCYENSLRLAVKRKCGSIAFPLISTGAYGFPKVRALEIAMSAIQNFLEKEEMLVYLVVFDGESFALSGKLFDGVESYIDEHYVKERLEEEYSERPKNGKGAKLPSGLERLPGGNMVQMIAPAAYSIEKGMHGKKAAFSTAGEKKREAFFQDRVSEQGKARSLEDVVAQLGETFQQRLLRLIDQRGMTDVEVYKKANLDRKLFSKIRCNVNYHPKKTTALALALALQLNLDETRDLLSRAELALSPSSKFDLIVEYFIDQRVYDIYTINLALFEHEQPLLGDVG